MRIFDGRREFYQWDIDVKITSSRFQVGGTVHFHNGDAREALAVKAYELNGQIVADVPNNMLWVARPIMVYIYEQDDDGSRTVLAQGFKVIARPKPADYIYFEPKAAMTVRDLTYAEIQAAKDRGDLEVTVVQNLGDSEKVVMSQKAVTDELYTKVPLTWELGAISGDTGDNYDISTTCRTVEYTDIRTLRSISVIKTKQLYAYDADKKYVGELKIAANTIITKSDILELGDVHYFRLRAAWGETPDIVDEVTILEDIKIKAVLEYVEALAEHVDEIDERLPALEIVQTIGDSEKVVMSQKAVTDELYTKYDVEWELGSIEGTSGNNIDSTIRVRTVDYIDARNATIITSRKIMVFAYDEHFKLVAKDSDWLDSNRTNADILALGADARYIRIAIPIATNEAVNDAAAGVSVLIEKQTGKVSEKIDELDKKFTEYTVSVYPTEWKRGWIAGDGTIYDGAKEGAYFNKIDVLDFVELTIGNSLFAQIFAWAKDGTLLGKVATLSTDAYFKKETLITTYPTAETMQIMVLYGNNKETPVADVEQYVKIYCTSASVAYAKAAKLPELVQETGNREDAVISQKTVTKEFNTISDTVCGKNLFDISNALIGKRMDDNGNIIGDASACVTDFIPVSVGDSLCYTYTDGGSVKPMSARRVIAYDADKNFIALLQTYQNAIDIRTEGASYLRMQFTLTNAQSNGQIEFGNKRTDYEPYTKDRFLNVNPLFRKNLLDTTFSAVYCSDITMVGDRIWGFKESTEVGVMDGGLYLTTINELKKTGICMISSNVIKHDFGHCNTVDYCSETDCLVFGNGSGKYNTDAKFYVIPEAHKIATRSENAIAEIGIEYDCTAYGYGDKLNVCWGYANFGRHDIVILITNDNKNIRFAQLGKGANNLGLGVYIDGKGDDEFNGSFKIIKEYTLDDGTSHPDSTNCNQGSDYADGVLYVSVGHEPHRHWEITFTPNGASFKECYEPFVDACGVASGDATEGMCVTDNYIITQESVGSANGGTVMCIRRRK